MRGTNRLIVGLVVLSLMMVSFLGGLAVGPSSDSVYNVERVEIGEFIDCIIVTVDDTVLMGPCVPKDWE